jgi:hypothetical protein
MTAFTVINDGEKLATVRTNPFSITLTDAGSNVSVLEEYEDTGVMTEMEAEAPADGGLALEEEWVNATDETVRDRLAQVASLKGWNIIEDVELP